MLKLVRTKLRRKILQLLILNPSKDYYLREIASLIHEDAGNCSRELKRFAAEGVVEVRARARAKFFTLNKDYLQLKELKELVNKQDDASAGREHVLFFCETNLRRNLFTYILKNKEREFYVRELAGLIGDDPGNLSRELKILEQQGLVKSHARANAKFYSLCPDHPWVNDLEEFLLSKTNKKTGGKRKRK